MWPALPKDEVNPAARTSELSERRETWRYAYDWPPDVATAAVLPKSASYSIVLEPHFENTLVTNEIARNGLIGAGGYMERLQSPTLDASLGLAAREISAFRLTESAPTTDFAARGVDDVTTLGHYPARDDALLVWRAMTPFIADYVRLYYATADDVAADTELSAWVDEMGSAEGGRLGGIARPATVEAVIDLVGQIVFRCTAHHASINYSSFDLFSYTPNVQTAAFGPGPAGTDATQAAYEAMLPPFEDAMSALALFYEITIQLNRLGHYPRGHFADSRVESLLAAYNSRLEDVESAISAKDATRRLSYPYQLPSRITQSIHV